MLRLLLLLLVPSIPVQAVELLRDRHAGEEYVFESGQSELTVHVHSGFFMNWLGKQKGEGIEFDLLVWAIALALIVQGAGAFSLDRVISAKLKN